MMARGEEDKTCGITEMSMRLLASEQVISCGCNSGQVPGLEGREVGWGDEAGSWGCWVGATDTMLRSSDSIVGTVG